jgi:hypothetical protein
MKDYKGKVLLFQESSFNATLRSFEPVLNSVNAVSKAYEDLDTTFKFTQEVFEDIVINGTTNISQEYAARIEDQIKNSKFTSKAIVNNMRDNISSDFVEISATIRTLKAEEQAVLSRQKAYPVELGYIKIESGRAVLNDESKEAIREIFTRKIITDDQNHLYNLMLTMKQAYEDLSSFLQENGINLNTWGDIISDTHNGLCYENNGELVIDPDFLTIKLKTNGSTFK